jgi:hypothetical protein
MARQARLTPARQGARTGRRKKSEQRPQEEAAVKTVQSRKSTVTEPPPQTNENSQSPRHRSLASPEQRRPHDRQAATAVRRLEMSAGGESDTEGSHRVSKLDDWNRRARVGRPTERLPSGRPKHPSHPKYHLAAAKEEHANMAKHGLPNGWAWDKKHRRPGLVLDQEAAKMGAVARAKPRTRQPTRGLFGCCGGSRQEDDDPVHATLRDIYATRVSCSPPNCNGPRARHPLTMYVTIVAGADS